jgi:hypothetical protein
MREIAITLLPFFMGAMLLWGTWLTTQSFAAQYTTLKMEDERRIQQAAKDYTDGRYLLLISEINRLRDSVDELQKLQAETLAEVKLLREN